MKRESKGQLEVQKGQRATQERVGAMDLQDLRDQKGCQVLTDQGDQVDLQETKGHLECQGHKGQRVTQEKMAATDSKDQLGPLGRGVLLAILDLQE